MKAPKHPPRKRKKAVPEQGHGDHTNREEWNWRPSLAAVDAMLGKPIHTLSPETLEQIKAQFDFSRDQLETPLKYVAATYLHYLNQYNIPAPKFLNRQAGRVKKGSDHLRHVLADLPPFFEDLLDEELRRKTGIGLKAAARGRKNSSLNDILTALIGYCDSFEPLLRAGAPRKDYLVATAKILIDVWEELAGEFKGGYDRAFHKGADEFTAKAPRFVQFILQDFDKTLTLKQVERAIREARDAKKQEEISARRSAEFPYSDDADF